MIVKTKGTVYRIEDTKTGVAKNGKFWERTLLVLKIDGRTPDDAISLATTFWNLDSKKLLQQKLEIGDFVEVEFSLHSEPSNDYWNTRISGLSAVKLAPETSNKSATTDKVESISKKVNFNDFED
jgi:hypothetical protein